MSPYVRISLIAAVGVVIFEVTVAHERLVRLSMTNDCYIFMNVTCTELHLGLGHLAAIWMATAKQKCRKIHLSTNGHVLECELEIVITFFVAHVNVIVIHRVRCQHWLRFSFFFLGLLFLIRICQRIFGLLSVDAQYTDDKMFFSIRASAKWEDKGYGTITSRSFIWNSNQVSCFFYTFHWRCLVYNFVPIGHPFFDSRWCVVVLIHDGNEHITRSLSGVWVTK